MCERGWRISSSQNREEFVRLYVQHVLVDSVASQFEAFARGFHTVCGGSALRLFQAAETEMLVCGSPELDFKALETSTTYEDGYSQYVFLICAGIGVACVSNSQLGLEN